MPVIHTLKTTHRLPQLFDDPTDIAAAQRYVQLDT
jgi:hypothetical protein